MLAQETGSTTAASGSAHEKFVGQQPAKVRHRWAPDRSRRFRPRGRTSQVLFSRSSSSSSSDTDSVRVWRRVLSSLSTRVSDVRRCWPSRIGPAPPYTDPDLMADRVDVLHRRPRGDEDRDTTADLMLVDQYLANLGTRGTAGGERLVSTCVSASDPTIPARRRPSTASPRRQPPRAPLACSAGERDRWAADPARRDRIRPAALPTTIPCARRTAPTAITAGRRRVDSPLKPQEHTTNVQVSRHRLRALL